MINRRGFFGALFAAAVAPLVAKALPAPALGPAPFDFESMDDDARFEELRRLYLKPAAEAMARKIDARAATFCRQLNAAPRMRVRFDPARLPA